MDFSIQHIDRIALESLLPLLNLSAGYAVSLEDELDCFDSLRPKNWLVAVGSDGRPLGFLRFFSQGQDWSRAEFFVSPSVPCRSQVGTDLLNNFSKLSSFPYGHRLRFEFLTSDLEMNDALRKAGYSGKEQRFFHFSLPLDKTKKDSNHSAFVSAPSPKEVAAALSNLHPVQELDAKSWISQGSIRAISDGKRIVAAAQIYQRDKATEINRIATLKETLRQGHATRLLEAMVAELTSRGCSELYLKVEDIRLPAISFYQSFGFREVKSLEQIWHSHLY